ncbi:acetylcholinesterase/butyrylcholinesterase, putative, partial [Ixodes scapularis]
VLRTVTAVVTVCMVCLARPAKSDVPIVHTDSGLVMGTRATVGDKRVDAFLGIPYAQPPVGDLRFRKPVPISPWKGTYNASSKPKPCWQLKLRFVENQTIDYSSASEDCLYLNVWRPSCTSTMSCEKKKSVIVFIHGGAFQWGDSSLFIYDAANFVALSDVVYVTFNYRLSILGFLSSDTPELPGNMGLWDQNLVLRWVKRNIGNFGGDANDITIDGQSAGGISAGLHAISPHSQGLFKRVIMSSGTSLSM